ncbi:hypothetical protein, partial [Vibrio parahaemolyticus]|uniref:hypothetical protein n=4 Tax=Vibrio parahaemolyticus TaxID=670 RepID=UPI001D151925
PIDINIRNKDHTKWILIRFIGFLLSKNLFLSIKSEKMHCMSFGIAGEYNKKIYLYYFIINSVGT